MAWWGLDCLQNRRQGAQRVKWTWSIGTITHDASRIKCFFGDFTIILNTVSFMTHKFNLIIESGHTWKNFTIWFHVSTATFCVLFIFSQRWLVLCSPWPFIHKIISCCCKIKIVWHFIEGHVTIYTIITNEKKNRNLESPRTFCWNNMVLDYLYLWPCLSVSEQL